MSEDLLGHEILESRINWLEANLADAFSMISFENGRSFSKERFVVSGVGSSEAHGRYLVLLINRFTDSSARFAPFSSFYGEMDRDCSGEILVVYSQGLSSNSQIVLEKQRLFKETILFTSSTVSGLKSSGNENRLEILEDLIARQCPIIRFPKEDEYTILIRVIGPMMGFLATAYWCNDYLNANIEYPNADDLDEVLRALKSLDSEHLKILTKDFCDGFDMTFTNSTGEYAQNLGFKVVEGTFGGQPVVRDGFQYAHGPFQQNMLQKRAQWLFMSEQNSESKLAKIIGSLVSKTGSELRLIKSPLAEPWAFIYYELLMNRVMLQAIQDKRVDQVNWPGKGEDGEVYNLRSSH